MIIIKPSEPLRVVPVGEVPEARIVLYNGRYYLTTVKGLRSVMQAINLELGTRILGHNLLVEVMPEGFKLTLEVA